MNNNYYKKVLKVNEGDYTHCPYIKIPHNFKNTGVDTPRDLNGEYVNINCVPNLSSRNPPTGFGINTCKNNKPIHLNFNIESKCYSDNQCMNKIETCYDPLIE